MACAGLIYISEIDAKIEPFVYKKILPITAASILKILKKPFNEKVEEIAFDQFIGRLTKNQDWHGVEENRRAEGFARLKMLLIENLRPIKVFKVGKIQIEICVAGIDKDGRIAGFKTHAVET